MTCRGDSGPGNQSSFFVHSMSGKKRFGRQWNRWARARLANTQQANARVTARGERRDARQGGVRCGWAWYGQEGVVQADGQESLVQAEWCGVDGQGRSR